MSSLRVAWPCRATECRVRAASSALPQVVERLRRAGSISSARRWRHRPVQFLASGPSICHASICPPEPDRLRMRAALAGSGLTAAAAARWRRGPLSGADRAEQQNADSASECRIITGVSSDALERLSRGLSKACALRRAVRRTAPERRGEMAAAGRPRSSATAGSARRARALERDAAAAARNRHAA